MTLLEDNAVRSAAPPTVELSEGTHSYSERVLVLAPAGYEAALIAEVLQRDGLQLCLPANMDEFCVELGRGAGAAVVAEEVLTPTAMQQLTEVLERQPDWSDFPILILFGEVGRSPEIALRMMNLLEPLGNVAILERPVGPTALVSGLRAALRGRRRQYQVHDLRVQQQRNLEKQQRFLSLLAHEVRNPLGAIQQATEILKRLGAPTNQAVEQRNVIARQTIRLARLIDNLLEVSQFSLGQLSLHTRPTDLRCLVGEALQRLRAELDAKSVQLSFWQSDAALPVAAEGERLTKVIEDILANALLLAAPGSRFELRLSWKGREAVVQLGCSDRQLGPALVANLLDPGREDSELLQPHTHPAMKIALGLAGKMLELHGGVVALASDQPPNGSAVVWRFPLLDEAPDGDGERDDAAPQSHFAAPCRVLIVEDNVDARNGLQLLIQLWGHRVQVAGTAEQGIQRALREQPDVALVDIGLPDVDGYEVARRLRAAFGPEILLLAMTGYGPPHDSPRAQQAGFDLHLIKPVNPRALQTLLRDPDAIRAERLAR